jgi:hypothetical protein
VPAGRRVTWIDLAQRGLIRGIPVDPAGVPYLLNPDASRVTLAPESSLNPMPDLSGNTLR